MELLRDYLASRVIAYGKELDDYTKIYFKTNENLVDAYRNIDFFDKDVLSVLASSDQVFTANYCGARKVDSFDKNILSLYYYYLRIWTIKYKDMVYPTELLDNNYKWLNSLLDLVEVKSEEEKKALSFWRKHLENQTDFEGLFFDDYIKKDGKTVFKTTNSIGSVIDKDMKFKNINLFEEIENVDDQYDIVLLSNIIEWARGSSSKMIIIRDNLDKLLNEKGLVLCTGLIDRSGEIIKKERDIFDSNFDFIDYGREVGYVYKKR